MADRPMVGVSAGVIQGKAFGKLLPLWRAYIKADGVVIWEGTVRNVEAEADADAEKAWKRLQELSDQIGGQFVAEKPGPVQ